MTAQNNALVPRRLTTQTGLMQVGTVSEQAVYPNSLTCNLRLAPSLPQYTTLHTAAAAELP